MTTTMMITTTTTTINTKEGRPWPPLLLY